VVRAANWRCAESTDANASPGDAPQLRASVEPIWHAQDVTENRVDRVVVIAVSVIVVVLVALIVLLGLLVGWLPAAILFAAVVVVVFMLLVAT
jgi:hypothetical protein